MLTLVPAVPTPNEKQEVVHFGAKEKVIVATKPTKKPTTQSVDPALVERSRTALHELPAELAKGERCEIVKSDGNTIGYAMLGVRGISFYVPDGHGKIEHFRVASERDLAKPMRAQEKPRSIRRQRPSEPASRPSELRAPWFAALEPPQVTHDPFALVRHAVLAWDVKWGEKWVRARSSALKQPKSRGLHDFASLPADARPRRIMLCT